MRSAYQKLAAYTSPSLVNASSEVYYTRFTSCAAFQSAFQQQLSRNFWGKSSTGDSDNQSATNEHTITKLLKQSQQYIIGVQCDTIQTTLLAPWRRTKATNSSSVGTGVIIQHDQQPWCLTAAHVVPEGDITLKTPDASPPEPIASSISHINHHLDLALLTAPTPDPSPVPLLISQTTLHSFLSTMLHSIPLKPPPQNAQFDVSSWVTRVQGKPAIVLAYKPSVDAVEASRSQAQKGPARAPGAKARETGDSVPLSGLVNSVNGVPQPSKAQTSPYSTLPPHQRARYAVQNAEPVLSDGDVCAYQVEVKSWRMAEIATSKVAVGVVEVQGAVPKGASGGACMLLNEEGEWEYLGLVLQASPTGGVAYILPAPTIQAQLLQAARATDVTQLHSCSLGVTVQPVRNSAMVHALGCEGVSVMSHHPASPCSEFIKQHDVITSIDGLPITSNGTLLPDDSWLPADMPQEQGKAIVQGQLNAFCMDTIMHLKQAGSPVNLTVERQGVGSLNTNIVAKQLPELVPMHSDGKKAEWVLIAGLMIQPLTWPLLAALTKEAQQPLASSYIKKQLPMLMHYARTNFATKQGQQVLVVSKVAPHESTVGYESLHCCILSSINGEDATTILHTLKVLEECKEPVIRLDFEDGQRAYFNFDLLNQDTLKVMETYKIPVPFSLNQ